MLKVFSLLDGIPQIRIRAPDQVVASAEKHLHYLEFPLIEAAIDEGEEIVRAPKPSCGPFRAIWLSNLPLRFRSDNSGVDRAAKPVSVWKPVRRLSGGGLRAFLCDHVSRGRHFCLGRCAHGQL
jgi:hypothetical protein